MFYASAQPVWSWTVAESNVMYYRTARDGDIVTVQFYIEQGNVSADDGEQGVGPTDFRLELPEGITGAGEVQKSFTYTVDPNYTEFGYDGLISVGSGYTDIKLNRMSGRWPLGTNFAGWGEITFPVEPIT